MGDDEAIGLGKVIRDLYIGNGKPALTVRVSMLEDGQERIERTLGKIEHAFYWLIGTVMGAIVLQIVNLVMKH